MDQRFDDVLAVSAAETVKLPVAANSSGDLVIHLDRGDGVAVVVTTPAAGWDAVHLQAVVEKKYLELTLVGTPLALDKEERVLELPVQTLSFKTTPPAPALAAEEKPIVKLVSPRIKRTDSNSAINQYDGAELVLVPSGQFLRGSPKGHGSADERPQERIHLDGYWIYKNPVTVAQFRKFCEATGRTLKPVWSQDMHAQPEGEEGSYPVQVNWFDAEAYAQWAGVALPTEAQWEKAARGTDGRAYPWGNDWDPNQCVSYERTISRFTPGFLPVGSCPQGASPYGVQDMAGNVWEWVADWYGYDYYRTAPDKNPTGPARGSHKVIRGGCSFFDERLSRTAARMICPPQSRDWTPIGFRCVLNDPPLAKAEKAGRALSASEGLLGADLSGTPQRDQVSLNGEWPEGGSVPQYFGAKSERRTYRRSVSVPEAWRAKHLELEFRQVNYSAEVFVNNQPAASHVGGWVPFTVDLTGLVQPGKDFDLRIEAKSSTLPPYADEQKNPLWPVGTYNFDDSFSGIIDDVWLRAYGEVAIHDAFIRTSFRDRAIAVDYTLVNHSPSARHVVIEADAVALSDGKLGRALKSDLIDLEPGATRKITLRQTWDKPQLWWPDQPRLYQLESRVVEQGKVLDRESRRFGFREVWISTNQYVLNGVRVNLWGDSIPRSWTEQKRLTPEAWPATIDMLKNDLNQRIIRWHQFPPSDYLLDIADQKGLMLIEESALYARPWTRTNQPIVIEHMRRQWIPEWIRAHRNHPSIVLWSAENEDYKHVGGFTPEQLQSLSEAIRAQDPTRPVIHDGDEDLDGLAATFNWHYPEGYEKLPRGSIYSWASKVHPTKPTGIGEFMACPWVDKIKPEVFWWHGTWSRGCRYVNFTDIRPFVMTWAWTNQQSGACENLRRSFSPVALFDKNYDDLGIAPLMSTNLPTLRAGSRAERTLVLYNDEYRGTILTVEGELMSDGKRLTSASKTYHLDLGEHRDLPLAFDVPSVGTTLELTLSVRKDAQLKFTETLRFNIRNDEGKAASSKTSLNLGDLVPCEIPNSPVTTVP